MPPDPGGHAVQTFAFNAGLPPRPRILALKLDHLGDFIIGLPSLRNLRAAFPAAEIHLVVGSWNQASAEACGLVDEVHTYDFFPRDGGWTGNPHEPLERFRATAAGRFDIAIDLRVDEDTRFLLQFVDAALRCGIGQRRTFPFLDVALPPEHADRRNLSAPDARGIVFGIERFVSLMPFQKPFHHETDFRPMPGHSAFGPYVALLPGSYRAAFALRMTGWRLGLRKAKVTVDVVRDGKLVALHRLTTAQLRTLFDTSGSGAIELGFENDAPSELHEFRVHVTGRPWRARLSFAGVRLYRTDAPVAPRLRRAVLHTGEQLSLLVQLLVERTSPLYGPPPPLPPPGRRVVVAPLSNSDLRDWPADAYVALIRLLVDRLGCTVTLLGSPPQAERLERIRRDAGRDEAVVNLGGQTPWSEVPGLLRRSNLVICNNSGLAHLAASVGAPTLAIYAGSHQPQEWGPRGPRSTALMAVVPCSPCGFDRLADCPFDHTCMRGLLPETVFGHAAARLSENGAAPAGQLREA